MASCAIFDPRPTPYFDEAGCLAVGAKAYFFAAQTNNPLTVYVDPDLTTPHAFPIVALSNGTFPPIYMPFTDYRVLIQSAQNVSLYDAAVVNNPVPASSGGGGISPTADQLFQTGFPVWLMRSGTMTGFVRMNGRTLGNASSGATEYANDSAQALFSFLYNLPDSIATVSGGRGVNSAADWSANKTIVIPTMAGIAGVGVDDMGGGAAQKIQIITTANVTNGSPAVTVGSATGLARGMFCIINGSAAGKILDVNVGALTVTLDTNYPGSAATGLPLRASFFSDAQQVGALGGSQTIVQTTAELPKHHHDITDPKHHHGLNFQPGLANGAGGSATNGGSPAVGQTTDEATGITINDAGEGLPTQIMQPSRLGTWYMKI